MILQTIILALCVLAIAFLGFLFYKLLDLINTKQEVYRLFQDFNDLKYKVEDLHSVSAVHVRRVDETLDDEKGKVQEQLRLIHYRLDELNKKYTNKY